MAAEPCVSVTGFRSQRREEAAITTSAEPNQADTKVALVIAAHPDDPDFGAGGTAALWSGQDWEFHYVVVTNGAKGANDPSITRERLISKREEEQRNAAQVLGVSSCTFLGGEDGELEYSREMLGKIVREIRRLRPYAVFTHADTMLQRRPFPAVDEEVEDYIGFVNHRDHRNTGIMAVDAVYPTARDRLNFPEHLEQEGLQTHNVRELYIWGGNDPNYPVDITDVIDVKVRGLTEHTSQFAHRGEDFIEQVKHRWQDPDERYYERFLRIVLPF